MMDFDAAIQYLHGLGHETLTAKLGLANTERLLSALGDPQDAFDRVQVAGTNGKGSTVAMLDAICRAAGISTGLYTSPHLISFTERIRINGKDASPELFARSVDAVRDAALLQQRTHGALPTFFEQMTAAALFAFRFAHVQLGILETGLGGRLDSTTAALANTVALTPIDLDHQEYLGSTLAGVAAEKAAIIRPGVTAIIAPQSPTAEEVIMARCLECGVVPRFATGDVAVTGACRDGRLRINLTTAHGIYKGVCLSLRGRHQIINASVAVELAEALGERGFSISHAAIIEGLETATHDGRLDLRPGSPPVLFDGAHNAAGARALRAYLDEFIDAPVTLVFGAMRDKDLCEIGVSIFPVARQLILTRPDNPRAATPEVLRQAVPPSFDSDRIAFAPTVAEALTIARRRTLPGGIICVTGSLYLVGEALELIMRTED